MGPTILRSHHINCIATLFFVMLLATAVQAKTVYVDHKNGDDLRQGGRQTPEGDDGPVRTFKRATTLLAPGDTLFIVPSAEPYRETLSLKLKGTVEAPIIIEGNNATIDLGRAPSAAEWTEADGYWAITFSEKLGKQSAFMFYRGIPVVRPRAAVEPGGVAPDYTVIDGDAGQFKVRFPDGMSPPFDGAYLLGAGECVAFEAVEHLVVRNLNVRGALNDGFGFHGPCVAVVLENCSAILCGDEGASAHGKGQMAVRDSLFAWNGSWAGGVTDVHETQTEYLRCVSAFGRGAGFSLAGGKHRLIDCFALGNARDQSPALPKDKVEVVNLAVISDPVEALARARAMAPENKLMARLVGLAEEIGWTSR